MHLRKPLGRCILLAILLAQPAWGQKHGFATLDSGAIVRLHLDTTTITGYVLVPFSPESEYIAVCDNRLAPCDGIDGPGALRVPVTSIKHLQVHGKLTGGLGLMGLYGGGLVGGLSGGHTPRDPSMGGMAIGMVGGALIGAFVGSRTTGWVPVWPCFHACAAGHYPER